ncbi:hypothetical protein AB0C81_14115 [Streptomyces roseoverticillatus]|uniref:hypothetical protein n=1 Tax=Streptomyces roseoverticillatus TaxID=66429 RepID=UPI0033CF0589
MDNAPVAPRRTLLRMITFGGLVTAAGSLTAACGKGGGKASAASSDSPAGAAGSGSGADMIMIIRHGEKPKENGKKPPFGITEDGERNDHALLVRGWQRAGALVTLFAPEGGEPRKGLRRPDAVYAAGPHPGAKGLRPSETVAPVAAKLGVRTNVTYRTGDEKALAKELAARHGRTLVSWEHNAIPEIVKGLGGEVRPSPPEDWPDARFDLVWVLVRSGPGWTFTQVPQLLLAGDSQDPA